MYCPEVCCFIEEGRLVTWFGFWLFVCWFCCRMESKKGLGTFPSLSKKEKKQDIVTSKACFVMLCHCNPPRFVFTSQPERCRVQQHLFYSWKRSWRRLSTQALLSRHTRVHTTPTARFPPCSSTAVPYSKAASKAQPSEKQRSATIRDQKGDKNRGDLIGKSIRVICMKVFRQKRFRFVRFGEENPDQRRKT